MLRAYLKRWKWEVGVFFEGVGPDASEAGLRERRRGIRCSGSRNRIQTKRCVRSIRWGYA